MPISDEDVASASFYKPADESEEIKYLKEQRQQLGGPLPSRVVHAPKLKAPGPEFVQGYAKGSGDKAPSTTGVSAAQSHNFSPASTITSIWPSASSP